MQQIDPDNTTRGPVIWCLQIIQLPESVEIRGTLLQNPSPVLNAQDSSLSTFRKIVRSYFVRPMGDTSLRLELPGKSILVTTNEKGVFSTTISAGLKDPVRFFIQDIDTPVPIQQAYPNTFEWSPALLGVISDIDDTILVSYTRHFFSKLGVMLFRPPVKRRVVPATEQAYRLLDTPQVQFFYVSRSEENLFHLIATFLTKQRLPAGPLFLRPFVHWRAFLQAPNKSPHKKERLSWILDHHPEKQFLLFGDDTRHDLPVFLRIAQQYPGRIQAAFIRRTRSREKSLSATGSSISAPSNVPIHFYRTFSEIEDLIKIIIHETVIRSQSDLGRRR